MTGVESMRLGTNAAGYRATCVLFLVLAAFCGFLALNPLLSGGNALNGGDIAESVAFTGIGVLLAYMGFKSLRIRVDVSAQGVEVHNLIGPVRRLPRGEISAVEITTKRGRYQTFNAIGIAGTDGRLTKCDALVVGLASQPVDPTLIAARDHIAITLGLPRPGGTP